MSNLNPEVRVNKLGVPVIKHVRPWTAGNSMETLFPAPSVRSDFVLANTRPRVDDILDVLLANDPYATEESDKRRLRNKLLPDTQSKLDSSTVPISAVTDALRNCIYKNDFALLNNMAVLCDLMPRKTDEFDKHCAGLQRYPHIMRDVDLSRSPELIEPSLALVRASSEMSRRYGKSYHGDHSVATALNSQHLSRLIAERPKDVGQIIDLLNERSLPVDTADDIEDIIAMLDASPTAALAEGVL